jgi:hypothetical protein
MRIIAHKFSRVLLILSLSLVVFGACLLNPLLFLVGGVLALSTRALIAPDLQMTSPHAQYWSRTLVLNSVLIFGLGSGVGFVLRLAGFAAVFSGWEGIVFGALLLLLLALAFLQTLPQFLVASWRVYAFKKGEEEDDHLHWSRFIVRASASCLFLSAAIVGLAL